MKKLYLPYLQIRKMNELLKKIPPKILLSDELSSTELAKYMGLSKSAANNLVTTLKSFNFITGKGKFTITENGDKYIKFLIRDNLEESKAILLSEVQKLDFFNVIENRLNQAEKLTNAEIGNYIAIHYDKNWENPHTVRAHGSAIASIFDFLGRGYYHNGVLSISNIGTKSFKVSVPNVGIKKIFIIMNALYVASSDVNSLSKKIDTTKNRLSSELSCCESLGLVERKIKGIYIITKEGEELINPNLTEEEKSYRFQNTIFNSPYSQIIDKLPKENLDYDMIGKTLAYELKKEWSPLTAKTFAKKFISWLKYSGIIEKGDNGKFRIVISTNNEKFAEKNENKENSTKIKAEIDKISYKDLLRYYLLGKNIGIILTKTDKVDEDEVVVSQIINLCRDDEKLKDILKYWTDDYNDLFKDFKDLKIFIRDINHLEELLGVKR